MCIYSNNNKERNRRFNVLKIVYLKKSRSGTTTEGSIFNFILCGKIIDIFNCGAHSRDGERGGQVGGVGGDHD